MKLLHIHVNFYSEQSTDLFNSVHAAQQKVVLSHLNCLCNNFSVFAINNTASDHCAFELNETNTFVIIVLFLY